MANLCCVMWQVCSESLPKAGHHKEQEDQAAGRPQPGPGLRRGQVQRQPGAQPGLPHGI